VLYNKDGSTLITYPAGKTDNFVNISRDVTEIANMAFYKCSSIKKVNYHGTSASWKSVEIGAGNDVIEDAIIYAAMSIDGVSCLEDVQVQAYPKPMTALESLLEAFGGSESIFADTPLENVEEAFKDWNASESGKVYARIPYEISIR
jgi:hypothetical protein